MTGVLLEAALVTAVFMALLVVPFFAARRWAARQRLPDTLQQEVGMAASVTGAFVAVIMLLLVF